jgi:hypothetical protein
MTWKQWISVLKLSQMWYMDLIQDLALRKVSTQIHHADEWRTALSISTQWKIEALRTTAIDELAGLLTAAEKVRYGNQYSVKPWLLQGYKDFVMRASGISATEEEQIGAHRTSNLFRLRHRRLEDSISADVILFEIETTFDREFANIAAFDSSPISYLRPKLRTVTDPNAIQLDETYYCVDIILLVNSFKVLVTMTFSLIPLAC